MVNKLFYRVLVLFGIVSLGLLVVLLSPAFNESKILKLISIIDEVDQPNQVDMQLALVSAALVEYPDNQSLKLRLQKVLEKKSVVQMKNHEEYMILKDQQDQITQRLESFQEGFTGFRKISLEKQAEFGRQLKGSFFQPVEGTTPQDDFLFKLTGKYSKGIIQKSDFELLPLLKKYNDYLLGEQWTEAKGIALELLQTNSKSALYGMLYASASILDAPESLEVKQRFVPFLEKVQKDFGSDFSFLIGLGKGYLSLGQYKSAEGFFEKSVEKNPTSTFSRISLGELSYQKADYTKARFWLEPLYEKGVERYRIAPLIWECRWNQKDFTNIDGFLDLWKKSEATSPYPFYAEGLILFEQKKYDQSLKSFEKSIQIKAQKNNLLKAAQCAEFLDNLNSAASYWKQYLGLLNTASSDGLKDFRSAVPNYLRILEKGNRINDLVLESSKAVTMLDPGAGKDQAMVYVVDGLINLNDLNKALERIKQFLPLVSNPSLKASLLEKEKKIQNEIKK